MKRGTNYGPIPDPRNRDWKRFSELLRLQTPLYHTLGSPQKFNIEPAHEAILPELAHLIQAGGKQESHAQIEKILTLLMGPYIRSQ